MNYLTDILKDFNHKAKHQFENALSSKETNVH